MKRGRMAEAKRQGRLRGLAPVGRVVDEKAYLYEIIRTISAGPDLQTMLRGIVRLVTEATGCHACFIYFVHGNRLVLRAASEPYAHLTGKVSMALGEGLTGWVAKTRRSAFIKENALQDPRVVYVPELDEEQFQSLVSVPVFARGGDVIGVITLHAEAPHEFTRPDLEFLEHTASLVAGAVENARLYEDATRKVALLSELSLVCQRIAAARGTGELLPLVAEGCRHLLGGRRCDIYLVEGGDRLALKASSPERPADVSLDARRLWVEALGTGGGRAGPREPKALAEALWGPGVPGVPLFAPLVAGDEPLGLIAVLADEPVADAETALVAIASQAAVAIVQHRLIERLKEENLLKDFFEALSRGLEHDALASQASRLGCDLDAPYVVLHAAPWTGGHARRPRPAKGRTRSAPTPSRSAFREQMGKIEGALLSALPGSLFDRRHHSVRGLLRVSTDQDQLVAAVRRIHAEVVEGELGAVSVGLSNVCRGLTALQRGFEEAASAAEVGALIRGAPGVFTYEDLGPYRYVLNSLEGVRDRYQERVERLADYDHRRGTQLLKTLERYLDGRGNIASTARALYIHPNTLRQRLARIRRITELDLRREDWLSLAIVVKVVKLRLLRRTAEEEGGND
jgi:GAF domain-containing protein